MAKSLSNNIMVLYVRLFVGLLLSTVTVPYIVRGLGEFQYGIYAVIGSSVGLFAFLNGSLASATQRFMSISLGKSDYLGFRKSFISSIAIHTSAAVLICVAAVIIIPHLIEERLDLATISAKEVVRAAYWILTLMFVQICSAPFVAVIISLEKMTLIAFVGIFESIVKFTLAYLIVKVDFESSLVFYCRGLALVGVLNMFIFVVLSLNQSILAGLKWSNLDISVVRRILSFLGFSLVGIFSTMFTSQIQSVIINVRYGLLYNAAHGIGEQLRGQLSSLSNTLMHAINPRIMKFEGAKNKEKSVQLVEFSSQLSFFLLAILAVPFILNMDWVLNIWLSTVPKFANVAITILLVRSLIEQPFIPLLSGINAVGRIKTINILFAILGAGTIVVSWSIGLFYDNILAFYVCYVLYSVIWDIVIFFESKRLEISQVRSILKGIGLSYFAVLVALIVSHIFNLMLPNGWLRILVDIVIMVLVLSAALILIRSKEERRTLELMFVK